MLNALVEGKLLRLEDIVGNNVSLPFCNIIHKYIKKLYCQKLSVQTIAFYALNFES